MEAASSLSLITLPFLSAILRLEGLDLLNLPLSREKERQSKRLGPPAKEIGNAKLEDKENWEYNFIIE